MTENRRQYLAILGTVSLSVIAGCTDLDENGNGDDENETPEGANLIYSDVSVDDPIIQSETNELDVTIENEGGEKGSAEIDIYVSSQLRESTNLSIESGNSKEITIDVSQLVLGNHEYELQIDDETTVSDTIEVITEETYVEREIKDIVDNHILVDEVMDVNVDIMPDNTAEAFIEYESSLGFFSDDPDSYQSDADRVATEVFEEVYNLDTNFESVEIDLFFPMVDQYGDEELIQVQSARLNSSTASEVQWNNFDYDNLSFVADSYWFHGFWFS